MMRLMIVGNMHGQLISASKIASENGARVLHVSDSHNALRVIRSDRAIDLIIMDLGEDIKRFVEDLKTERIHLDVIACGMKGQINRAYAMQ